MFFILASRFFTDGRRFCRIKVEKPGLLHGRFSV